MPEAEQSGFVMCNTAMKMCVCGGGGYLSVQKTVVFICNFKSKKMNRRKNFSTLTTAIL